MASSLKTALKVGTVTAIGVGSFVSAIKVKSREYVESPREYDDKEREATVFLYTRKLTSTLPDSREFHHWALVFEFEGDDIRTAEGLVDEERKLYAVYSKVSPQDDGHYYKLGKILTSPKNLLELCQKNYYNWSEYLAAWQNCQLWVKELATMLGTGIVEELRKYPSLYQVYPKWAAIGAVASGVGNFSFKMFTSSKSSS